MSDVRDLAQQEGNSRCFNCNLQNISSVCILNAVFICTSCKTLHDLYLPHITIAKPLDGNFTQYQEKVIRRGGNENMRVLLRSYNIPDRGYIQTKYQTYAAHCYRDQLRIEASGGDCQFEWPNREEATVLIGGYRGPVGTLQQIGAGISDAYGTFVSKADEVVHKIERKTSENALVQNISGKAVNFFGKIENRTKKVVSKITSKFSKEQMDKEEEDPRELGIINPGSTQDKNEICNVLFNQKRKKYIK